LHQAGLIRLADHRRLLVALAVLVAYLVALAGLRGLRALSALRLALEPLAGSLQP
jgi:hypothetical protein